MRYHHILVVTLCVITATTPLRVLFAQDSNDQGVQIVPALTPQPFANDVADLCSEYVRLEAISAYSEGSVPTVLGGQNLVIEGVVENKNTVSISGVSLLAAVYKQTEETPNQGKDILIDQFIVQEDIGLGINSKTPFTLTYPVPTSVEQGTYYVAYSLFSQNDFSLLSSITAPSSNIGTTTFIAGGAMDGSLVTFEKNTVTLGESVYDFSSPPPMVGRNDTVQATALVLNPTQVDKTVTVQWLQYATHSQDEKNLRYTNTESVTIPAGQSVRISYDVVGQLESRVQLVAQVQDGDSKRILTIPFIREGGFEVQTTFTGLTNFPLAPQEPTKVIVCAEAPYASVPVPDVTVEMTLRDKVGDILTTYTMTSIFLTETYAFVHEFTPTEKHDAVTVDVRLLVGGGEVKTFSIPFTCDRFTTDACKTPDSPDIDPDLFAVPITSRTDIAFIASGIVLIILLGAVLFLTYAKQRKMGIFKKKTSESVGYYK